MILESPQWRTVGIFLQILMIILEVPLEFRGLLPDSCRSSSATCRRSNEAVQLSERLQPFLWFSILVKKTVPDRIAAGSYSEDFRGAEHDSGLLTKLQSVLVASFSTHP